MPDSPFEPRDSFKPFLLDRLLDPFASGERSTHTRGFRANARRIFDEDDYRASVTLNLSWLFNTPVPSELLATPHPEIQESVVAFGLPGLTSMRRTELTDGTFAERVRNAICWFEPRVRVLEVEVNFGESDMSFKSVSVIVRGTLWMLPKPQPIAIRSDYLEPQSRWIVRDA